MLTEITAACCQFMQTSIRKWFTIWLFSAVYPEGAQTQENPKRVIPETAHAGAGCLFGLRPQGSPCTVLLMNKENKESIWYTCVAWRINPIVEYLIWVLWSENTLTEELRFPLEPVFSFTHRERFALTILKIAELAMGCWDSMTEHCWSLFLGFLPCDAPYFLSLLCLMWTLWVIIKLK